MYKLMGVLILVICIMLVPASKKFASNQFKKYSQTLSRELKDTAPVEGVIIKNVKISEAEFQGIRLFVWKNVDADIKLSKRSSFLPQERFSLKIEDVRIIITDFLAGDFRVILTGITAEEQEGHKGDLKMLKKGKFQTGFKLNIFKPASLEREFKEILKRISTLFHKGETIVPVQFSGILSFQINSNPVSALVSTDRNNKGNYILVVNKEFFQTSAWFLNNNLTEAEAVLLSRHPFKLPTLMQIMTKAQTTSEKYKNVDGVPEDAYRHVLWSFLLTKTYGPEFAQKVTDAHESGDPDNTQAESLMDLNNNAIGRAYAQRGYDEKSLLQHLLKDPKVIRTPKNIDSGNRTQ